MVGYIYLITDTTNNMKYVGQHHYNKEGELDPNYHGSGIIISRIYKERPETLKEEYIKTCYSDSEMNDDEKYYIKLYKTLYPNGYNLSEGGDGVLPSEETRRKMSEAMSGEKNPFYGRHHSEESKKKISDTHKGLLSGEKHPFYGRHLSEETKRKLSKANKGKHLSVEHKRKISEATSGEKNPFYGRQHSEESRRKMSGSHKGKPAYNKGIPRSEEVKKKLSKKVLQFTLNGEFVREWPSVAECGRNGFCQGAVSECCQGKRKSHKGFRFMYK